MRRCGVCLVAVHGRVEVVGLWNPGVLSGGSRSGQSWTLDLWAAFDVWSWSSSASTIPTPKYVCSTAFGVCDACPSKVCLLATSNCRKPDASLLYLASSAPRLGPETCTKISNGGFIVCPHLEKRILSPGKQKFCLLIHEISSVLCKCSPRMTAARSLQFLHRGFAAEPPWYQAPFELTLYVAIPTHIRLAVS